jgi:hypothetical protein
MSFDCKHEFFKKVLSFKQIPQSQMKEQIRENKTPLNDSLKDQGKGKSIAAPPFQLMSSDAPIQGKLSNDTLVVRGGMSSPENLITNQANDDRGHISANSANGANLQTLATTPEPFKNGSLTVSDVGTIRGIKNDKGKPMDVLEDPTKNNPVHASIEPNTKSLSTDEAGKLSKAFVSVPNEWKKK